MIKKLICKDCGNSFMGYHTRFRCDDCITKRKYATYRRSRKEGVKLPIGSTNICPVCGKEYTVTSRNSKYCSSECMYEYRKWKATIGGKSGNKEYTQSNVKRCAYCGKEYIAENRNSRYCSSECYQVNRKYNRNKRHLGDVDNCLLCGKEYIVRGGVQKYCPECSPSTNYKRKKNNYLTPQIVYIGNCISCGKKFALTKDSQKYCPDCDKEQRRIKQQEYWKNYYANNKDNLNQKRREKKIKEKSI